MQVADLQVYACQSACANSIPKHVRLQCGPLAIKVLMTHGRLTHGGTSCQTTAFCIRVLAGRSALTGLAKELKRVPAPEEVWNLEDMEGAPMRSALRLFLASMQQCVCCHPRGQSVRKTGLSVPSSIPCSDVRSMRHSCQGLQDRPQAVHHVCSIVPSAPVT